MRAGPAISLLLLPTLLSAQSSEKPSLDFSGLIYANFQVRTDSAARIGTGGKPANKFDISRVYLNFRLPAGDRANIRVTTDIFQQSGAAAAYYGGWAVRLKYGILQYDYAKDIGGVKGLNGSARFGMLQTITIEHVETFWPRWLGVVAVETHGFFSSSDVGAAHLLALPSRRGEIYATITNGPGYASAENDRFKDVAARASFTPFANDSGFFRSFTVSPWYYKGWSASQFVTGGGAQVGPVSDGLQKDRRGIFAGIRDRKLTLGAEYAQRIEDVEGGANTLVSPRTLSSRTGNLMSAFAVTRPAELFGGGKSRLSLIGRFDRFEPDANRDALVNFMVAGAIWELNQRVTLALDYQELSRTGFPIPGYTTPLPTKTFFLHWTVPF